MGLYRTRIFPFLVNWSLSTQPVMEQRRRLLSQARGRVLELGVGTGLNSACYSEAVSRLTVVDLNAGMLRWASRQPCRLPVDLLQGNAEELPLGEGSVDTVVSSFTLCSIGNPERALMEIRRVLATGGHFLFLEHGLSPDPGVARWQHRLTPLQRRLADGCHLNRNMASLVASQLELEDLETFYLPRVPRLLGYLFRGRARRV